LKFEKIHNKGQAQIFKNAYLEFLTKTHPLVIWGLYLPIIAVMLYYSYSGLSIGFWKTAGIFLAGMFTWSLFEYVIHRYIFHFMAESERALRIVYVPEVVINMVDFDMVQQTSLASCEFPKGTNEFIKAGFTEEKATMVKPPMVKESKVKLECKVLEVKPLGTEGGAGNLVICEVLCMHIDETILDADNKIDQTKLHHVARLGGDWYAKIDETNLFKVAKPNTQLGIGVDSLPESIRNSNILSANNLGQLANVHEMPFVDPAFDDDKLKNIIQYFSINPDEMDKELHRYAKELLDAGKVNEAWQVLLADY